MDTFSDKENSNILILSRDEEIKGYLKNLLEGEGFKVSQSPQEGALLSSLAQNQSDLLVLDMETINALDCCKKVRESFLLRHIPIIMLVNKEHTMDKMKGIYAGADDYLEKPVDPAELLIRIKASLWRAGRDLDANPLSKLPGNVSIIKELDLRIKSKQHFCVGYADLSKFKEYNDYYGFEAGDKAIKHCAEIISRSLLNFGSPGDFLGHIGGDDFIFICEWDSVSGICDKIISDFTKTIPTFYRKEDLEKGYIVVKDRSGKVTASPMMTIAIGVAANRFLQFSHVGEIIQIATELKNYAKTFSKSIYIIDRRKK